MSEPKRGNHYWECAIIHPNCPCNTCQRDGVFANRGCCDTKCSKSECKLYIKDEPTKKGAADV